MKALQKARKPNILEWIFALAIMLAGVALMYNDTRPATTPENELVELHGVPTNVKETVITKYRLEKDRILECDLDKHHFEYSQGEKNYERVRDALSSGEPVDAWVSTKPERRIIPDQTRVRLYKLVSKGSEILSYDDVMQDAKKSENNPAPIVLVLIGALGLFINWKQLNNYNSTSRQMCNHDV